MNHRTKYLVILLFTATSCFSQKIAVPDVHTNIKNGANGLELIAGDKKIGDTQYNNPLELEKVRGKIAGTSTGLYFDFSDEELEGTLVFGLIPKGDSKYPHPVFRSSTVNIMGGKVAINISRQLAGRYDMVGWAKSGKGTIGYRVINKSGEFLYDGQISFKGTGPFEV